MPRQRLRGPMFRPARPRRRPAWTAICSIPVSLMLLVATAGSVAAKPPPDTIIDSGPAAATTNTTAAFTFHSNQSPATFSCRLDGSPFVPCASPTAFSGLAAGSHTFYVYATVGGVPDSSPATSTWMIDLTPPSAPAGLAGSATTPSSVSLSWTAGLDNVAVTRNVITRNGSTLTTVGAVTGYVDANAAPATTYTYTVLAQDAAGNTSPASNPTTVTTPSAPDTLIDSGPTPVTHSNSAIFAFHSTAAGATFICKLDGGKANNCTSPRSYTGLSSGSHRFSGVSTAHGISDPTPATATWTIDLIAP